MTATTELPAGLVHAGVWQVFEHPDVALLQGMLSSLAAITGDPGREGLAADAHRVDQLGLLERVKGAAAAAQARVTTAFEASQLVDQDRRGVRRGRRGRGIADQVALARGCPASQGSRHLAFATAMAEMPHTLGLLTRGEIGEWTATVLVQETAVLTLEGRKTIDERLCALSVDTATGEVLEPLVLGWTPRRGAQLGPGAGGRARPGCRGQAGLEAGARAPRHDPSHPRHHDLRDRAAPGRPGRGCLRQPEGSGQVDEGGR